jgi:hypothetical protein
LRRPLRANRKIQLLVPPADTCNHRPSPSP